MGATPQTIRTPARAVNAAGSAKTVREVRSRLLGESSEPPRLASEIDGSRDAVGGRGGRDLVRSDPPRRTLYDFRRVYLDTLAMFEYS